MSAMNVFNQSTGKIEMMPTGGGAGGFGSMLGPISSGLNIASGVFDGLADFSKASMQRDNAKTLERRAAQTLEQGFLQAIDIGRAGDDLMGEQRVAFGKSGSELSGSPLSVLAETADKVDEDIQRTLTQARIKQQALLREAKRMKKAAKRSKIGGYFKMATSPTALFG